MKRYIVGFEDGVYYCREDATGKWCDYDEARTSLDAAIRERDGAVNAMNARIEDHELLIQDYQKLATEHAGMLVWLEKIGDETHNHVLTEYEVIDRIRHWAKVAVGRATPQPPVAPATSPQIVGWAVYGDDVLQAAMYNAQQGEQAMSAGERWKCKVSAVVLHPMCPTSQHGESLGKDR